MTETAPAAQPWPAVSLSQSHALLTRAGSPFEVEDKVIEGRPVRVWKNAPPTLRHELLAARAYGERPFLIHEDERVTFEAFYRACVAMARRLQADGVQPGDRVAVVMRNMPEWPVAFYGASIAGAIVAPLNAWWTADELAFGLADCGAKAVVLDGERYDRVASRLPSCADLERVYVARHTGAPNVVRLDDVLGKPNDWGELPDGPPPEVELSPESDCVIFYTSGTSGKPKGALLTHRMVTANVMAAAFSVARLYVRRGQGLPEPDPTAPQKGYIAGIPFFHVTGFCALLQVSLTMGYKLGILRKWDCVDAFRMIERERLTNAGGVPTLAWQMLQDPRRDEFDLSSLELVTYGGAAAAPEIVPQLKQAFPNATSGFGWGMTETGATFTMNGGEDYENRPASSGAAMPVGDMRVVDMNTLQDLPPGEVGELWVRGPNVFKEYWNNPAATAETIVQDGWLRTGDLARLDEEGFLYVVDRAKDMIIRGGENIYCIEVENVMFEHPAVADAALVSMPHPVLGEEPGAVVVLNPGASLTAEELQVYVRERLAPFKAPVKVLFSDKPLPRNANGKVIKPELKALLTGG
jgi:long-chain acyl-CoA synthetase